uniref:Dopamine receptor, putative n=1 Tax=Brugia malayi TaxID=6279 RepID=A8PPV5_BRUMA
MVIANCSSQPRCELRLKPLYALGSSMCSFVIPAAMMILLYTRLYLFAREHAKTMRIQLQQAANFSVTLDACEGIQNFLLSDLQLNEPHE